MTGRIFLVFILVLFAVSCTPGLESGTELPLKLASSIESNVTVALLLDRDLSGGFVLAATFTPEAGYHLYSKDLPLGGVNGLGRPTRLDLVAGTRLRAAGELSVSVPAVQAEGQEGLWIYPAGPVTLRLPVLLPDGRGWFDDQVSVTYMACSDSTCSSPVIAKLIAIRLPETGGIEP